MVVMIDSVKMSLDLGGAGMMMSTSKFKVALVAVQELEATIIVNEALLRFSNVSLCNDPKPEPEKWRRNTK